MKVLDIETTTNHKEIRLVGIYDSHTKDTEFFSSEYNWDDLRDYLEDCEGLLLTWNGAAFDIPLLLEILGIDIYKYFPRNKHVDAMLLSKMITPDRYSHSLDSYGKELGFPKGEVDYDFAPIHELSKYLERDLQLTYKAYEKVFEAVKKHHHYRYREPLTIECKIAEMIAQQGRRGIGFNYSFSSKLMEELQERMDLLNKLAKDWLPEWDIPKSKIDHPPKVQFKKDGMPSKYIKDYLERNGVEDFNEVFKNFTHPVTKVTTRLPIHEPIHTKRQLTLANTADLKKYLLAQGWEPSWWNYKKDGRGLSRTTPRLTHKDTKEVCPNIKLVSTVDAGVISDFLMLSSRYNTLKGLRAACTRYDIIHHSADTLGTPTARFKHRTVVNIPRVSTVYGKEFRGLFRPIVNRNSQVGWDASSLEATIEAHHVFKFDRAYAKDLIEGDIHTRNMELLGLPSRDKAKELKYALTYGARAGRVSDILGVPPSVAEAIYDQFWNNNKGLEQFKIDLYKEWLASGKKAIKAIDGRPLFVRHEHAILNTKLQGDGAILMKYAYIIAEQTILKAVPEARPLIRYHDEEQWECDPMYADTVGRLGVESIERAGKHFYLNVPITGEYKIGSNWADCH